MCWYAAAACQIYYITSLYTAPPEQRAAVARYTAVLMLTTISHPVLWCLSSAVLVSTNAHKLGISRRTAFGAGASAAFAAPAHAASELVNFEDGTIGLRFQYPKGWRCRGTGALMGLVAGNRVTTCIAVHEANCRGCFRRRGGVVSPTP